MVALVAKTINTETYSKFKYNIIRLIRDMHMRDHAEIVHIYQSEATAIISTV